MSKKLDPKHFAGSSAPEPLRRFYREKTFAALVSAVVYAIENDIPAQRFSLVEDVIEDVLAGLLGDFTSRVEHAATEFRARGAKGKIEEINAPFIQFFRFVASLHPVSCEASPSVGPTPAKKSDSPTAQELTAALDAEAARYERIDEFLSDRESLKWYPNSYVFLKAFEGADHVMSIAQAIDELLPQFLQSPPVARNDVRRVEQSRLLGWRPLLNKIAKALVIGESNRAILSWVLESIYGSTDLVAQFEDQGIEGAIRFINLMQGDPEYVDPFIQRLGLLGDDKYSDDGGVRIPSIGIPLLLSRVNLKPIDRVWDDGKGQVLKRLLEKISGSPLKEVIDSIQPFVELDEEDLIKKGAIPKWARLVEKKVQHPSLLSVDSLIGLLGFPAQDDLLFQFFMESLELNFHELTRDGSGDFRMPWSRNASERLGGLLDDYITDGVSADKYFEISPVLPLMFFSRDVSAQFLPEYFGFDISDLYGERIQKHTDVITELVHCLYKESWPKLAAAILAYHLIMHALEKQPLNGLRKWRNAIELFKQGPGSEFVQQALVILAAAGVDQRTREWSGQFVEKVGPTGSHTKKEELSESKAQSRWASRVDAGTRAFVEQELIRHVDNRAAFYALHERTRNWLLDFELRWRNAQPDFGSGEFSGWGSLGVEMWKPFENEIQERLAIIWQGDSGEKAREFLKRTKGYTVRQKPDIEHYLLLIMQSSPPSAVQDAFKQSGVDMPGLQRVARTLRELKNLRNRGAHPAQVLEVELLEFRTKLLRGGLLRDFVLAITAGDLP